MRISDWSSDVCSSDLRDLRPVLVLARAVRRGEPIDAGMLRAETRDVAQLPFGYLTELSSVAASEFRRPVGAGQVVSPADLEPERCVRRGALVTLIGRSEEHTSELQSLMRKSYAVFCFKKKQTTQILKVKTLQQSCHATDRTNTELTCRPLLSPPID